MKLYDRDYTTLTAEEEAEFRSVKEMEVIQKIGTSKIKESLFHKYPKAARHYISLFPNNYLDFFELKDYVGLNNQLDSFKQLLDSKDVKERSILDFINKQRAYFIIASILKRNFNFGHHGTYLFPEFPLGTSHRVDYLIIGLSSDGYQLVFVELESPKGKSITKKGMFGESFRKGISQLNEWQTWLEGSYYSLKETFNKLKRTDLPLPDELITLDTSRLHFVVIAGRREDFQEKPRLDRRKYKREKNFLLLHYDNLIDAASDVIGQNSY